MTSDFPLVWIDLEMTGLDPETDRILEMATIITDDQLNIVAEGPVIAIYQPQHVLEIMNEWCVTTHESTGLIDRVKSSRVTEREAEEQTLMFLCSHLLAGVSPMCGNTIYQDRRFLFRYMVELHNFFHYRNIDVSTVKELAKRWRPDIFSVLHKEGTHKAIDDIRESIEEMRYYREHFFELKNK